MDARWIRAALAATLAAAATAHAQQPVPAVPADTGFFRPRPDHDVSLTKPLPQELAPPAANATATTANAPAPANAPATPPFLGTPPAVGAPAVALTLPAPAVAAVPVVPVQPAQPNAQAAVERQMDRSEQEAQRDAARINQGPAPVNGAFNGLTSERDR